MPDTRATAYLRFIANNINSSENAIIARPSHSDEFLLTPLSSTTEIEDQRESQVPVNFLPTVDIEFTVTSTRHVIWLEYVTRDYY